MIAVAVFFTFSLQFYVPMEIIWNNIKHHFSTHKLAVEYSLRILLVVSSRKCLTISYYGKFLKILHNNNLIMFYFQTGVVAVAIAVPDLGPLIGLIGAVCLSTLGLMFPAIIETVVYWERPGMGAYKWRLWKNCFLILFGVVGFLTGSYVSIEEIRIAHGNVTNQI